MPLNDTAWAILSGKHAVMHGQYVFYNPVTGDRFYDLKARFYASLKRAGRTGVTVAYAAAYPFASSDASRRKLPSSNKVMTLVPRKQKRAHLSY